MLIASNLWKCNAKTSENIYAIVLWGFDDGCKQRWFWDKQERSLVDGDGDGNKYSLYNAVVKEALRRRKISAKQPSARSGCVLFFLRRTCPGCVVSTRGALSHLLECRGLLWGRRLIPRLSEKSAHATWRMFTSGRSRQPSPVVVSVLFTCAAAAAGGGGGGR